MRFKAEVREFMRLMRGAFLEQKTMIEVQQAYCDQLLRQNAELHNRLMSKDYPEFRTFEVPSVNFNPPEYDYREDEGLTGAMVNPEEYDSTKTEK